MDSWLLNKVAGAVLAALLVAFGSGTLAEIFGGHAHGSAKPGFELPAPAGGGAAGGAAAVAFKPEAVVALLKTASADGGKDAFGKCRACHTADKDGKSGQGPNLWGVLGRPIASNPSFGANYSATLKGQQGPWTFEKMAEFLHSPSVSMPGTKMSFNGVKADGELADIIAYLRTLSDSPVPLPN